MLKESLMTGYYFIFVEIEVNIFKVQLTPALKFSAYLLQNRNKYIRVENHNIQKVC